MTWFVHHEDKILGPFPTDRILRDLKDGEISYSAHIWSKGQVEWIAISDWESNLAQILDSSDKSDKKWKVRTANQKITEDLSFDQVLENLRKMDNFQLVAICQQDKDNWVPVYSSYAFMEALNLSRRSFLRAPLMGLSKITKDNSRFSYVVKTATIGRGGIGLYGLGENFVPGTQVTLKVESEDLSASILARGTIVYHTDQGFVGIRFAELKAESEAVIIEYMKRFQDDQEITQAKAS